MKTIYGVIMCLLSLFLAGPASGAESLREVMAKVASVYGPEPGAIRETGTTYSVLQGEGTLLRLYKFPDQFHIEIAYADSSENRTLIGGRAWNKKALANPMSRGAIELQAARIALPWSMLSRHATAVDIGTATAPNGKPVRVIEVPLEEARRMIVEVDPDSGFILRTRGIQMAGDSAIEFSTSYSDFRKEGGRVHAAREEQFAAGTRTGFSIIDRIEYLDSIPDSAFAPWASADSGVTSSN